MSNEVGIKHQPVIYVVIFGKDRNPTHFFSQMVVVNVQSVLGNILASLWSDPTFTSAQFNLQLGRPTLTTGHPKTRILLSSTFFSNPLLSTCCWGEQLLGFTQCPPEGRWVFKASTVKWGGLEVFETGDIRISHDPNHEKFCEVSWY